MAVRPDAPVLNFCVPEHEKLFRQDKKETGKTREFSIRKSKKLLLTNFLISISESGARVALSGD